MGSLLLLALLARCAAAAEEGLAVALHAQAYPVEGGVIVGSVMTTNGLKRALLRSGRVRVARSFYPFHYSGIADEAWDLVIIEGWFEMSNAFIQENFTGVASRGGPTNIDANAIDLSMLILQR